ncbi:flavodoxin domain-containing protein [Clostridium grantii]|uniref:Menaquinone-dependent protoporphyrinogen oxidase n=1 Tax=Clostridium grantii DSM 8605 TaxID=1121316 RepID=A0A1M5VMD7_9CLOT|nr:flavodoxin domain-containing protein [Clostridium grantii]SHH76411.1 menaquinone-dependent protoporphyrinogen oxidase [Clostridium grantii DSM 8605]
MRILIAYGSKHGATEKAAKELGDKLKNNDVHIINLKKEKTEIDHYDTIIIGGSLYAGILQKEVKAFCVNNESQLAKKKLGFFLCCGNESKFEEQLDMVFPKNLLDVATAKGYFGYEYDFKKMNFLEKIVVKKVVKVNESKFEINEINISDFAKKICN